MRAYANAKRINTQPTVRLIATDILAHLDEKDRVYFRETREKRLGATLETVTADRETNVLAFRETLEPVRTVLAAQPYVGGGATGVCRLCRVRMLPIGAMHKLFSTAAQARSGLGVARTFAIPHLMDLQAKRLVMRCDANSAGGRGGCLDRGRRMCDALKGHKSNR